MGPSLKDLARILSQPRETIRRILDSGQHRWAAEIVVLANICSSASDSDIRVMDVNLPGLKLLPTLALVTLGLIAGAVLWVLLLYLFSWVATLVGRKLEGEGTVADVRTALAWSLVPVIWSVIFRIPIAVYRHRFLVQGGSGMEILHRFVEQGGCTLAVIVLAVQLAVEAGVVVLSSFCVGEALRFSTAKGFATVAISAAIPIVVVIAAVLAVKM